MDDTQRVLFAFPHWLAGSASLASKAYAQMLLRFGWGASQASSAHDWLRRLVVRRAAISNKGRDTCRNTNTGSDMWRNTNAEALDVASASSP